MAGGLADRQTTRENKFRIGGKAIPTQVNLGSFFEPLGRRHWREIVKYRITAVTLERV